MVKKGKGFYQEYNSQLNPTNDNNNTEQQLTKTQQRKTYNTTNKRKIVGTKRVRKMDPRNYSECPLHLKSQTKQSNATQTKR